MVEGKRATVVQDMPHHIFEIAQNIDSFDPQDPEPMRPQPNVAPLIMRDPLDVIMPASINLNRQAG